MKRPFCDKCDQPIQGKPKYARLPIYKPNETRAFNVHITHNGQTHTEHLLMYESDICVTCAIEIMQAIIKENAP